MNLQSRPRTRKIRAFTLIELMVVVLILAVLAALVVPKIVGAGDKAKVQAAHTDIKTIRSSLDQFQLDCGRYPTTEEGLQVLSEKTAPSGLEGKFSGPYVTKPILNDPWNNPYQYESDSNRTFTLRSYGADGVEGGADYDADIIEED